MFERVVHHKKLMAEGINLFHDGNSMTKDEKWGGKKKNRLDGLLKDKVTQDA